MTKCSAALALTPRECETGDEGEFGRAADTLRETPCTGQDS